VWDFHAAHADASCARCRARRFPQIGRIEISVQLEDQSRWLSFTSGAADLFWLDGPLAPKALVDGKLRPELASAACSAHRRSRAQLLLLEYA
jgi:hypothetical protein